MNVKQIPTSRYGKLELNTVDLSSKKPSPEGEGWVTTARMQEVEQRREQLPRGNSNKEKSLFKSPHPSLLPEGEGARTLKSTALKLELPPPNSQAGAWELAPKKHLPM